MFENGTGMGDPGQGAGGSAASIDRRMAVASVLALIATVALFAWYGRLMGDQHAYEAAPRCDATPPAAGSDCWYDMTATVAAMYRNNRGSQYRIDLRGAPPADGSVAFADESDVLLNAGIGDTVHVRVWRGRVVRVTSDCCSDTTLALPRYPARRVLAWALAVGLILAALLGYWSAVRRAVTGRPPIGNRWYRWVAGLLPLAAIAGVVAALVVTADMALPVGWVYAGVEGLILTCAVVVTTRRHRAEATLPRPGKPRRRSLPSRAVLALLRSWRYAPGLLAVAGTGLALASALHTMDLARAYRAAPVCGDSGTGGCRNTMVAHVVQVGVIGGRDSADWLYLEGPAPVVSEIDFGDGAAGFLRTLTVGEQVTVEVWCGQVTRVAANGRGAATSEEPQGELPSAVLLVALGCVGAVGLLRWAARTSRERLWHAGRISDAVPEVVLALLGTAGCVLIWFTSRWGVLVVGVMLVLLLYVTALPGLLPARLRPAPPLEAPVIAPPARRARRRRRRR